MPDSSAKPLFGSNRKEARHLWTIYTADGKRATIATFLTRLGAERQLDGWREQRAWRPDVDTAGLYVAEVQK